MGPLAYQEEHKWTYADYLTWDDGQRWEIIDGEAFNMSPAPTLRHQAIIGNIFSSFHGLGMRRGAFGIFVSVGRCGVERPDSSYHP